ncbi:hypothetical protein HFD92_00885 [Pantoea sp. EKM101V]|uniref:hypothetical protein n=1 Tax=Pantoea sp. EKM101V TaxID=1683695 RepID=UPI00142E28EE|nr:hypothetical protein [Pantoea sp. EKM101V]KAF6668808.1 hypothetical protein HFD92_00885 [Pantoea sp. EKM101V]
MFLKKVIPCLILALASSAMSGCVMAEGGRHHYGHASDWHHHGRPAMPDASQHMGPPPAASRHMGPPPAPSSDSGIHRWHA